jgi:hypothetical protein
MPLARRLLPLALVLILLGGSGGAVAATRDKALTAPSKLGQLVRFAAVTKNKSGPGQKLVKRYATWSQKTAAIISAAYGGAPAVMERYSDQTFATMAVLYAVRAPSPKLWTAYTDPVFYGVVRPLMETQTFGAVTCLVQNAQTPRGQKPAKDSMITLRCQRSDAHLTVIVEAQGAVQRSPSGVAALVDDAWSSLQ